MEIAKGVMLTPSHTEPWLWSQLGVRTRYLVPVANQPMLFHNLDALAGAGVRDVAMVVDSATAPLIRDAVGDGSAWRLNVHYIDAPERADAVELLRLAQPVVQGEPCVVQRGDVLVRDLMRPLGARFSDEGLDALALRLTTSDPGRARGRMRLARIDGEPETSDIVGAFVRPDALNGLAEHGGRRGLDALIAGVTATGGRVDHQDVDGCVPCSGERQALLEANRQMLDGIAGGMAGADIVESEVQGTVLIGEGARLHHTTVRGPAIIGPGANLSYAYVGPYTSIGRDVVLEAVEIEHSIVLPQAELRFVDARVESSIVGRGARVTRGLGVPRAMRLLIANGAEVTLA